MHSIGLGTYEENLSKYSSQLELFEESLGGQVIHQWVSFDHAIYLEFLLFCMIRVIPSQAKRHRPQALQFMQLNCELFQYSIYDSCCFKFNFITNWITNFMCYYY